MSAWPDAACFAASVGWTLCSGDNDLARGSLSSAPARVIAASITSSPLRGALDQ
ncbi:MAG: hypothetical protein AAGK78_09400 [Planctomycetota bacterium]